MKNKIISFLRGLFLWDAKDLPIKVKESGCNLSQSTSKNSCTVPAGSIFIAEPTEYDTSFLGVDGRPFNITLNRQFKKGDLLYVEGRDRLLVHESEKEGFAYVHKVSLFGEPISYISSERLLPGTIIKETKDDYRSLASYVPMYHNQKRYASRINRGEAKTDRSTMDYISDTSSISSFMEDSSSSSLSS